MLLAVNTDHRAKACKNHGSKIKVMFDTGIVMYVTPAIFDVMLFHLEDK